MAAPNVGVLVSGFTGGSSADAILSGAIKVGLYILGFVIFVVGLYIYIKRKKEKKAFCIPVTIWIPRSDGKIMDEFSAVGGYFKSHAVGGITSFRLKRKGASTIDIPPPSSRFLVGLNRHLYLVQKGMDDFEPVLPDSFKTVETEKLGPDGKFVRKAVINLKCKNQDATAWCFDNAEQAKKRFTLHGLWEKYKDFIQMTVFIFIVFLCIYIMWTSMKGLVSELGRLVDILTQYNAGAPIVN